jgi:hypothetical protein
MSPFRPDAGSCVPDPGRKVPSLCPKNRNGHAAAGRIRAHWHCASRNPEALPSPLRHRDIRIASIHAALPGADGGMPMLQCRIHATLRITLMGPVDARPGCLRAIPFT